MTSTAERWSRFERSSDAYATVTILLILLIVIPILTGAASDLERFFSALLVGAAVTLSMAASRAHRWAVRASWMTSLLILLAVVWPGLPRDVLVVAGVVLSVLMISSPVVIMRRIGKHTR